MEPADADADKDAARLQHAVARSSGSHGGARSRARSNNSCTRSGCASSPNAGSACSPCDSAQIVATFRGSSSSARSKTDKPSRIQTFGAISSVSSPWRALDLLFSPSSVPDAPPADTSTISHLARTRFRRAFFAFTASSTLAPCPPSPCPSPPSPGRRRESPRSSRPSPRAGSWTP